MIESRFKDLLRLRNIEALLIKIDYMTNLSQKKEYFNDFLFQLCFKKYINIQGEHYYLDENILIVFELTSYSNNFLLDSMVFLKMLEKKMCAFDLNEYKFNMDIFSDEQLVGFGFKHFLIDYEHMNIVDYSRVFRQEKRNIDDLCEKFHTIYQLTR